MVENGPSTQQQITPNRLIPSLKNFAIQIDDKNPINIHIKTYRNIIPNPPLSNKIATIRY